MPPRTVRGIILNALRGLTDAKLREFCGKLIEPEWKPRVYACDVDNKSRTDITELLVSRCSSEAVVRTIDTLRDIGCNFEADELAAEATELQRAARRNRSPRPASASPSLSSYNTGTTPRDGPKELLWSVRPDFVENVSDPVLNQLLDLLLQEKVLTFLEMEIATMKPRAGKARYVLDTVVNKGTRAASFLIEKFCELDSYSELCAQLSAHSS